MLQMEEASEADRVTAQDPASEVELESRNHALGILMALASRLEEEDLRVLISLARRMGRSSR
jgi:hypothetical protein